MFSYTRIPPSFSYEPEDNRAGSSTGETSMSSPLEINRVPAEIWMTIVSWLPPSSAASLAFSSKELLRLIGDQPWKDLESADMKGEKLQFLSGLEPDLPNHILCPHCVVYRPACQITSTNEERLCNGLNWIPSRRLECAFKHRRDPAVKRSFEVVLDEDHVIDWWLVQMITCSNRFVPSPEISVEDLNSAWETPIWESGFHWRHSSIASIVAGKLLVKFNSELQVNALDQDLYCQSTSAVTCGHPVSSFLDRMCRCAIRHVEQSALTWKRVLSVELCDRCSPIHCCPECASEYWITVRKVSANQHLTQSLQHEVILSLTRYIDLGSGSFPPTKAWDFWMDRTPMQSSIYTGGSPGARHRWPNPGPHNTTRSVERSANVQRRFEGSIGNNIPSELVRTIGNP